MARPKIGDRPRTMDRDIPTTISKTSLDGLADTLTQLRVYITSECTSQVEKDIARAKVSFAKDILARFGLTVSYGLRGKCEITRTRKPRLVD